MNKSVETNEIWKDILGYEEIYQVSNLGQVKSKDRNIKRVTGQIERKKGRILKPIKLGRYLGVQLCKNTKMKSCYIHRLVAEAFIENTENKGQVNHIDGDKENNKRDNLEWVTQSENNKHSLAKGLRKPRCKFSDETVLKIRELYATGKYTQVEISEEFGVSKMQVCRIVNNKNRKSVE